MNIENLKPFTSEQSREAAVKNGRKGGKASGESRRKRQQIRQIAAAVLSGTYTDDDGKKISGEEVIARSIAEIISDSNHKYFADVLKLLTQLTDSDRLPEQLERDIMSAQNEVQSITESRRFDFVMDDLSRSLFETDMQSIIEDAEFLESDEVM